MGGPHTRAHRDQENIRRRAKRALERESKKPLGQRIAEKDSAGTPQRTVMSERERKFDPSASTEDLIKDLRYIQEINPTKHITRIFYRNNGVYSDKTWGARFGTFLEFRREAGLEHHRGGQRMERDIAKHAAMDRYRGFYEVEVLPWVGRYEHAHTPGMKVGIVFSDIHAKQADMFVLDVVIDTCARVQPDFITINGDAFELAEFSRFSFDPRSVNIREEFEFVRDNVFKRLREACPDAQIDFIIGNHDWRILHHMADRTPYIIPLMHTMGITLSKLFGLEEFEINLVCKADFAAYQIKDSRDEIAKNYKVYFDTLLVGHHPENFGICSVAGHTHRPYYQARTNELVGSYFQLTLGCVAKVDVTYVTGLNKYSQSFGVFHIDPATRQCVPEHIIFSQDFAVVGGIVYRRPMDRKAG